MYQRILLPTDGSELSRHTILSAIQFAKNSGASVVGVHVIPLPREDRLEAWVHHNPDYGKQRQALFGKFADEYLSFVASSALTEGVPCTCKRVEANEPYLAILQTAEHERCDLIYMASHGWKGDEGQLLGSETLKVLHHSPLPVLVYKLARGRTPSRTEADSE